MSVRIQESFNFYSHLVGGIAALVGTIYLAKVASHSASALITALIYGLSIVFLFFASTLYHRFKKEENELSFWRKMDRLAIFFMIAGTYTPICYFCLEGYWRWTMIAIQWGLVGFGVISQLWFPRAPRSIYVLIYIVMGWAALLPIKQMLANMSLSQEVLLFSGGAAFTLGGLIYAIKKPRLVPGIFSFHELFHVLILVGGALHYAMIYRVYFEIIA
ncbi:MAG: hemolysin III family protein [Proteobacteria bacterium]|nr:hemolysin III family protein [Desulfobacula sp.]MBU3951843.1 hemolysin III family protein [Pseudomonadota bacterium]MBU4130683.1 hemolysin III family protein [Pseudomonadota bacterium]